jgi:MFS family permease
VLSLVAATLVSGLASAYFAAVVISLSFPLTGLVLPVLGGELFGYRTRGNMVGFALAIVNISGTVSSPLINTLYDNIGSYRPVFQVTALVTVLVILLFCLLFRMADRSRKRHDTAHVMI